LPVSQRASSNLGLCMQYRMAKISIISTGYLRSKGGSVLCSWSIHQAD
jgi:hypothetical protein